MRSIIIVADLLAGLTLSIVKEPAKYLHQCSSQALSYFSAVPLPYRNYLCTLYTSLQSLNTSPGAYSLVSQLVRFGTIFNAILAYESHRQTGWLARRGLTVFLLLAQLLSGAVASPLYFALIFSNEHTQRVRKAALSSEAAWSVLFSLLLGYLLPVYAGSASGWSNNHITAFLGFPVYLAALNSILPWTLRSSFQGKSSKIPIILTALLCIVVSAPGYIKLLWGEIPLHKAIWPFNNDPGVVRDVFVLLLHDYMFAMLALASYAWIRLKEVMPVFRKEHYLATVLFLLITQGDPACLVAWVWGASEYYRGDKNCESDRPASESKQGERSRLLK